VDFHSMHVGLPYEAANSDDVPAGARLAALTEAL